MKVLAILAATSILVAEGAAESLRLVAGRGAVVDCPEGVARVATSNPESVDAVVPSATEVLFQAKAVGQASLIVWPKDGPRRIFEVTVEPDLEPLRQLLRASFPDQRLGVEATRDSLALVGYATSRTVAEKALALVKASFKGAVDYVQIAPEKQILLRVRFAELNRSADSEFGINLLSTGALRMPGTIGTGQFPSGTASEVSGSIPASSSGTSTKFTLSDMLNIFAFRPDLNLGALIRDLQSRHLLEILAEPNLVTTDGKEASFLAGGEFPVPILQAGAAAGAITVQFWEYGIRLNFLPQLTPNGTIRLHVRPEVSTIDPANGISFSGFSIPALSTRRVETDIELAEGQSFVIGGMLNDQAVQNLSRLPGLANIPVLGALFRSHSVTKARTELVVVVTPEIAHEVKGPLPIPPMPVPFLGAEAPKK
jgi:pilus assembly protein CpaC